MTLRRETLRQAFRAMGDVGALLEQASAAGISTPEGLELVLTAAR